MRPFSGSHLHARGGGKQLHMWMRKVAIMHAIELPLAQLLTSNPFNHKKRKKKKTLFWHLLPPKLVVWVLHLLYWSTKPDIQFQHLWQLAMSEGTKTRSTNLDICRKWTQTWRVGLYNPVSQNFLFVNTFPLIAAKEKASTLGTRQFYANGHIGAISSKRLIKQDGFLNPRDTSYSLF